MTSLCYSVAVANAMFVLESLSVTEGADSSANVCVRIDTEVGDEVELIVQLSTFDVTAVGMSLVHLHLFSTLSFCANFIL